MTCLCKPWFGHMTKWKFCFLSVPGWLKLINLVIEYLTTEWVDLLGSGFSPPMKTSGVYPPVHPPPPPARDTQGSLSVPQFVAFEIWYRISFLLFQRLTVNCSTWFVGSSCGLLFLHLISSNLFLSLHFHRPIGQHAYIGFLAWLEHFVRVWSHQDPSVSLHGTTG